MVRDLTEGKPLSAIIRLALPMLLGALFQQLYNVADMYVVGNAVGSRALAAIGATGTATFFSQALVIGLSVGFTAVTAQFFGAKDTGGVQKSFAAVLYISAACTALLAAAGFFGAWPLLRLLHTPDDILFDAARYLRICVVGGAGMVFYNALSAVLRALGDSRTPLLFLIFSSVLNVLLDFLFVWLFGMGVTGAAVATVVSQGFSAALCLAFMLRRFDILRLPRGGGPPFSFAAKICRIGLPVSFQTLLLAVGDMTITRVVNAYGADVVAAYAAGQRIWEFSMMFCMNLSMAFAVFAGQNLGANKIERIKRGFRAVWLLTASLCALMSTFIFVAGDSLVRLFIASTDAHIDAVSAAAHTHLRVTAAFYLFLGLIWHYNYTLRSLGDIAVPFVSGLIELLMKVGLSFLLSFYFGYTGIWFAMPAGWVFGLIPSAVRYHTGGWAKRAGVS